MIIKNLQNLQTWLKTYHKGAMVKATWRSEKLVNGVLCEKVSNGVIRFVAYENMNSTKLKRQQQKANGIVPPQRNNNGKVIIKDILYQANNGNLLVSAKTTKHKATSDYKVNGVIVDKATYETYVKPNNGNLELFTIKLENLISLG